MGPGDRVGLSRDFDGGQGRGYGEARPEAVRDQFADRPVASSGSRSHPWHKKWVKDGDWTVLPHLGLRVQYRGQVTKALSPGDSLLFYG